MKAVDQTTFGVPGGNCFSACVASLLELPIEEVPYFMHHDNWLRAFEAWCLPRGYYPLCFLTGGDPPRGLHILSGQSSRGSHSVVARGAEVLHDPHPSRDGLLSREDHIVLVALDPARQP